MILQVTNLAAIPQTEYGRIDTVYSLLQKYGTEKTREAMQAAVTKWAGTKSSTSGRFYSKTNFAWIDWAMSYLSDDGQAPQPTGAGWKM
mgnify:CR=1 FL=1